MALKWYLSREDASWGSFWDKTTIDNELEEIKNDYPKMLNVILENSNTDSVVLEGGCGLGKFLFWLKEKGYKSLIGVDFKEKPLRLIKQRDAEIDVRVGDVNELPLADKSIDLYLSMGVIEHFEEGPQKSLGEAYRVLKVNGILIAAVPYQNLYRGTFRKYITMPILKLFKPSFRNRNRIFYQYYLSKDDLEKNIKKAGFDIMDWFYYDQYHLKNHRIGISLEFPFLRKKNGARYELNWFGEKIAAFSELFSKGIFSSSIAYIMRKPNQQS